MIDSRGDAQRKNGDTPGTDWISPRIATEELYKAVVEHVADGIAITVGTKRAFVNKAFLTIHGLKDPSEAIGLPFDHFIIEEDREVAKSRVFARLRGEPVDGLVEYRIRRPDGEIRAVQVSVVATTYEDNPAILAVLRDVTDLKQAEQEIVRLNRELEQHVRDLTNLNHDLETFNSTVSHDLRIPLMAVEGFSRRMEEHCGGCFDERCTQYLSIIRSNSRRMEQLISDLLAYSRVGRQALEPSRIAMGELFETVAKELQNLYPEGTITISALPDAKGDPRLIRQVVENLLSNAFKFTKHKDQRKIEVKGWIEGGECVYSIKDNGAGFDMEQRERLFEIFQRFHSPDQFEGTGVGLAIVKRIVTLHGGEVRAEGKLGEGATFYFTLPSYFVNLDPHQQS